ncbi:Nitrate reductase gamma subunit [Desulfonatronum thiosulfatophilum]|uniref:Nitrate reductase gamma subunit n=1 Tax=Desulfonatronum thiosulfatophilum TaxID=617002 RepID=A0A1G6CXE7_9BACT|nr:respiratory nitrate reductase subunit gamma [Desulfonatronum thiosulfatophilum]SDB37480.1 Nitrate reductase gamma subunit [Desulfonatronum thiosulfatophilum]
MYNFLTGPMVWITFLIVVVGLTYHVVTYIRGLDWRLDRVGYRPNMKFGLKGAARSIFFWILPWGSHGWRAKPLFTLLFFAFHIGLVFTPIFLEAHNIMLKDSWGIRLPAFSSGVADALSWIVVVGGIFLILRRIAYPEVRILTSMYDYVLIIIAVAPFLTGLIARYNVGDYHFWLLVHIITGHIFLLSLVFTRLNHAILFFMTRAQLGMDYGIKRGGMKGSQMSW